MCAISYSKMLAGFTSSSRKQRAETASKSELRRISNITAHVLHSTLVLASIVVPFAAESIHRELFSENNGSIFMEAWPKPNRKFINKRLEEDFGVLKESANAILYLREQRNAKLRWPIKEAKISYQRLGNSIAGKGQQPARDVRKLEIDKDT